MPHRYIRLLMPTPQNVIFFESPAHLRAWFEANHESATELWVGQHRKQSGRPSVTWPEVVDQCLCFGWIDSVRYSLDKESFAQRLTPRRKGSNWSTVNIKRFGELDKAGLARPKGKAAFASREDVRSAIYSYENRERGLDKEMEAAFRKHSAGWKFFESQAPWYRRTAAYWVVSAKREETRTKRLQALIDHSTRGEKIPPLRARPSPHSPARGS
jgi:uncharacterized protein YdeI (YjbR/CyaY-like superfamily)